MRDEQDKSIYIGTSNKMVHTPGMYRWAMACDRSTWNKDAKDVAARMYILADIFPVLPATILKQVAEASDKVDIQVDDDTGRVTISYDAHWEGGEK